VTEAESTPVLHTPTGRRATVEATCEEVLEQEERAMSTSSRETGLSQGDTGVELPGAAARVSGQVVSLASYREQQAASGGDSANSSNGPRQSVSSHSSKAAQSAAARSIHFELANANVPKEVAEVMAARTVGLQLARDLGPVHMAAFFIEQRMIISAFDTARLARIFSTPLASAPPPPLPGPVLASRLASPPGMGGPEIAAQIPSSGLGAQAAPAPPPPAVTSLRQGTAAPSSGALAASGAWLFTRCVREKCTCASTYNGQVGKHCSNSCRDGVACTDGLHKVPSAPDAVLGSLKLMPMPTTLVEGIVMLRLRGLPTEVGMSMTDIVTLLYAWQCEEAQIISPEAVLLAAASAAAQASVLAAAAAAGLRQPPATTDGEAELPEQSRPPTPPVSSGEEMSTAEIAIVRRCRSKARKLDGELWTLIEDVPDESMPYVLKAFMRMHEPTRAQVTDIRDADFKQFESAIVPLHVFVDGAFSESTLAGSAAVKQCLRKSEDFGEAAVMALSLAASANNSALSRGRRGFASGPSEPPPSMQEYDTVRVAANTLADDSVAPKALEKIVQMAKEAGTDAEKNAAMLAQLAEAQRNPEFGAELALLLGQEKLTSTPAGAPLMTSRVWNLVLELRARVAPARVIKFEPMMPATVNHLELITAVSRGKLTMGLICGSEKLLLAEQKAAALRIWPVLIALHRECFPRSADEAEQGLLLMANDAFERSKSDTGAVKAISPVFATMATRFAYYTHNGGVAPKWVVARYDTTVCGGVGTQIDTYLNPPEPANGNAAAKVAWAETQAIKAKLAAEAKVKADAAAKGGGTGKAKAPTSFA
jgi:hypothetical protein